MAAFFVRDFEELDLFPAAEALYDAFFELNQAANPAAVKLDFASVDVALAAVRARMEDESSPGVVAVNVKSGRVIGCGFIVFGGEVNSLSLVAVSPSAADRGIGKKITAVLLEKSRKTTATSVRLAQGAPNTELLLVCQVWISSGGKLEQLCGFDHPRRSSSSWKHSCSITDYVVRKMELSDVPACSKLFNKTMGYNREAQFKAKLLKSGKEVQVILKNNVLMGYSTGFNRSSYTLTTDEESAIALFSAATSEMHLYIIGQLYPRVLRWALEARLCLIRHGSKFMALGSYQRPQNGMFWSIYSDI